VQAQRHTFRRWVRRQDPRHLVDVDEFGTHLGMTRRYARAPRGERAVGAAPQKTDPNVTLTFGIRLGGAVAPMAVPGATDGWSFEYYVRACLAPHLRRGDVVLVDGLPAHRVAGARRAIRARGARLRIRPAYSPDLAPIENAGAKLKADVRGAEPRTLADLYAAQGRALDRITRADVRGYFAHAGYLRPDRHRRAVARAPPL